jgi:hypothetical protein
MEPIDIIKLLIILAIIHVIIDVIKTELKFNKMNKQNKLPKYWCVKNDGSQLFKDTVVKYMKTIYPNWEGSDVGSYYGFTDSSWLNGTDCNANIKRLHNNPTLLTLQEFIDLTTEQVEFKDDSSIIKGITKCWCCYKTGARYYDNTGIGKPIPTFGANNKQQFYYFKTEQRCQDYLDNIHNKTSLSKLTEVFGNGKSTKTISLKEIEDKLSKHYDKNDIDDIIEILTK